MNELRAILNTYENMQRSQQSAALATVVNTIGSTYRRPGARMLVTNTGQIVGMVSGGCLENDVLEHAKQVMQSGKPRVITYDTTAHEDIIWGLGLGCNGVIQILIEPLEVEDRFNPLTLLAQCFAQLQPFILATVFDVEGATNVKTGDRLLYYPDSRVTHNINDPNLVLALLPDVQTVLAQQQYIVQSYCWAEGSAKVLLEWIQPPTALMLFGAGQDAIPVAQFAKALGWQVTIVDCRASELTPARFPMADQVILTRREIVHQQIQINANTIAVVMTHNYLDDAQLLKMLLSSSAQYVGMLGPKHRTERLLQTLQQDSVNTAQARTRLHAPVGLDLGADTPEAIALSIIAEIQAVLAQRSGGFLRNRQGAIHPQSTALASEELLCLQSVL